MKINSKYKLIVSITLSFGLIARILLLIIMPAWGDEIYSVWAISQSFTHIAIGNVDPVHPPGYYLILKIMSQISTHLYWLRLTSLCCFIINSVLILKIGKKLFPYKPTAIIWLFLYSFSGYFIIFDWQVRMYTPALTLILTSILLLTQYQHSPNRKTAIYFMVINTLGLYLDYTFVWYALPLVAIYSIYALKKNRLYEIGLLFASSLILFFLIYPNFFHHVSRGILGIGWMEPYLDPHFFVPYFLGNTSASLPLTIGMICIFSICAWHSQKNIPPTLTAVWLAALISTLGTLIFSYFIRPLFHIRSLQIVSLSILLIIGIGVTELIEKRKGSLIIPMLTMYLITFISSFFTIQYHPGKAMIQTHPWKKIIQDYRLNDDNILVVYNQTNHGFSPMLAWGLDYSLSGKDRFAKPIKHYESTKLPSGYTCSTIDSHFVIVNKCLKE